MTPLLPWFWGRLERLAVDDPLHLARMRWVIGVLLLAFLMPSYQSAAQLPEGLLRPMFATLPWLSGHIVGQPVLLAAELVQIFALAAVTVGLRARWAGVLFASSAWFGFSYSYAFGKVAHDIYPFIVVLVMGFGNWGTALALWPDPPVSLRRARRPQVLLALGLALAMVSAGLPKALHWLDFDLGTSGFLAWLLSSIYDLDRGGSCWWFMHLPPLVHELADISTVLMEMLGIVVLLLGRRAFLLWLAALAFFHAATAVALGIGFFTNALAYLVFLPPRPHPRRIFPLKPVSIAVGLIALAVALGRLLDPSLDFTASQIPSGTLAWVVAHTVGCSVCGAALLMSARRTRSSHR